MAQAPAQATPYTSKDDFLANGLEHVASPTDLECPICQNTIKAQTPLEGFLHAQSQAAAHDASHEQAAGASAEHEPGSPEETSPRSAPQPAAPQDALAPSPPDVPEPAVRIRFCSHVLGRACLFTWINLSADNRRCPCCSQALWPARHQIPFWIPTLTMRSNYAYYLELIQGDVEAAARVRQDLMHPDVLDAIRDFTRQLYVNMGLDVELVETGVLAVDLGQGRRRGGVSEEHDPYDVDSDGEL